MIEFGAFSEILIILIAGLILIGPKELPRVLYQCGRWLQKIRHLNHQLRQGLDHYVEEGAFDEYVEIQNKKHLKTTSLTKTHKKKAARKATHE